MLGASDGQELSVEYAAAFPFAGGRFLPGARVSYWSDKLAYYGTFVGEVSRGVLGYRPDAFVTSALRLGYIRSIGENWPFYGVVDYRFLPSEVRDSPLVDEGVDGSTSLALAFTREL